MLKSLYFKLNDENKKHKEIIDFFERVSKDQKKVDVLYQMITLSYDRTDIRKVN